MQTHMTECQLKFLHSMRLSGDKDVVDCDPDKRTITFKDGHVRQICEIYSRVMGYHRPLEFWNAGKQQEHRDRRLFSEHAMV